MRSVADATCSRRVIPEQVITYLGCNRYPAGVSISPRIRAAGRLSTPSICLKDCALASIAKEPHPDAFIEYAADFPERGGPRHLLHFGTAYKLGRLHQLDFHVGAGLSRAAVDHFIGVGYSFRFQAAEMNAFLQTINSCWGLPLPSAKWIQRRWSCAGVGR